MRWLLAIGLSLLVPGCTPFGGSRSDAGGRGICEDTCRYVFDGECDDGGPGSLYSVCAYGTDCGDCGVRGDPTPMPRPGDDAGPGGCRYPAVDCPPIGCVSGGPYCCRVGTMANSCFETYAEAQRLCSSMIFECGATPEECPPGSVLISWDGAPAVCSALCSADGECPSGSCQPTSLGDACAPGAPSPCSPACAGDQICVTFSDGSASCGDRCSSNGQCASECCGSLESGERACVPSRFCAPSCTPYCAGRRCGESDGCGGTCDAPCDDPYQSCVQHRSDPSVRYCAQLCETVHDCCPGSPPGAVREGRWCCMPAELTGSGLRTCGFSEGVCAWYSHDICGG